MVLRTFDSFFYVTTYAYVVTKAENNAPCMIILQILTGSAAGLGRQDDAAVVKVMNHLHDILGIELPSS